MGPVRAFVFLVWLSVAMTGWSAVACAASPVAGRIAAVEKNLGLDRLMSEQHVPGISVAVVENFRLAWAKGYGVTELGGSIRVTPDTRFLAGSISKPVAAVGALRLVEEGKLALNADVNSELKSWKVPGNEFTRGQKVTLERLLDHTAGFTGGEFFPGYAVGRPVPTLTQILDGSPPAMNPPMRVGFPVGSKWQYSGDGYMVVQQLMMNATGESFPQLMREAIFDRLGMRRTTYQQPIPDSVASSASAGTLKDGSPVPGRWHVQPEWSTSLARLRARTAWASGSSSATGTGSGTSAATSAFSRPW